MVPFVYTICCVWSWHGANASGESNTCELYGLGSCTLIGIGSSHMANEGVISGNLPMALIGISA